MKKLICLIGCLLMAICAVDTGAQVKNPDTFVLADYADPHNFVYPFMHSNGYYGKFMALRNAEIDKLCDAGIATADTQKRREIYAKLQNIWYENAIGVPLYQQIVVRAYRDTVYGFVPNAMFTDDNEILKRLFKQ